MSDNYQSPFFSDDDEISSSSPKNSDDLFSNSENQLDLNSFASPKKEETDGLSKFKGKIARRLKMPKTPKQKILKGILTTFLVAVITVCIVIGAFMIYVFGFVDDEISENLYDLELNYTTTVYVKNPKTNKYMEYQRLHGSENRIWVNYNKELAVAEDPTYKGIPQNLADAFVAIEDERFYTHGGVDWKRTFAAFLNMFVDLYSSNQGGSTITQQLVKNLTQDNQQSAMRKVREIMRARKIESTVDKDTILECYLNTITFANGIGGVEVASNYYYNKSVSELSIAECAGLAAIVKEPERYRPDKFPENNATRRKTVLAKMLELGYITKEEYDTALVENVKIVANKDAIKEVETNNYFIDALIDDVVDALVEKLNCDRAYAEQNFYNGGYKIYATMNPDIQSKIDKYYSNTSNFSKNSKGVSAQSSITVMDYKGNVVGISGGVGKKSGNRSLNRATSSPRQPGSSIKPITAYSLALDQNIITYSSMLQDTPTMTIVNEKGQSVKWPKNAGGSTTGANVTMARALEKSYNTIPVQLIEKMGLETVYNHAVNDMGIKNFVAPFTNAEGKVEAGDQTYASLGLGGSYKGITTLESCAAFATFGNGGRYYEPTFFTKVTDQHGDLVVKANTKAKIAMSEDSAVILNKMLQNVVNQGTGTSIRSYLPSFKVFGKTGTTDDNYNLWFAGGTPHYVASCWYGYDKPERVSAANSARKTWGSIMRDIHSGLDKSKDFPESDKVTCRKYCTASGEIATDKCTSVGIGWYKTSYLPSCTTHGGTALGEANPSEVTSSNTSSATSATSSGTVANSSTNTGSVSSGGTSSAAPPPPTASETTQTSSTTTG